ncbi:hypothetical protein SUGI_0996300 [Cryptomeria japonica]|nr:hypothetical protein SUGI_0996300 [Cryptomeria japonica]
MEGEIGREGKEEERYVEKRKEREKQGEIGRDSTLRQKKISSRTPKRQKKHMGFTELMNAPDVDEVQQREEEMVIAALDSTRPPKVTGELYEASAPCKLPNVILPFHFSRSPTRILWDPTRPRQKEMVVTDSSVTLPSTTTTHPSEAPPPVGHPTDPQPHRIVEDKDEPRTASKRLDFDDPPQS